MILKRTTVGARIVGDLIEPFIGNANCDQMDPDTAIRWAMMIYGQAKKVKRRRGDPTATYGFASLTDARMDELEAQKARDGTAVFAKGG